MNGGERASFLRPLDIFATNSRGRDIFFFINFSQVEFCTFTVLAASTLSAASSQDKGEGYFCHFEQSWQHTDCFFRRDIVYVFLDVVVRLAMLAARPPGCPLALTEPRRVGRGASSHYARAALAGRALMTDRPAELRCAAVCASWHCSGCATRTTALCFTHMHLAGKVLPQPGTRVETQKLSGESRC